MGAMGLRPQPGWRPRASFATVQHCGPKPRLSMPARRRAVMPPRREKMMDAGLLQLSSFSTPHFHRPLRNGEEGRGAEGVQGEEGRAREEEVM